MAAVRRVPGDVHIARHEQKASHLPRAAEADALTQAFGTRAVPRLAELLVDENSSRLIKHKVAVALGDMCMAQERLVEAVHCGGLDAAVGYLEEVAAVGVESTQEEREAAAKLVKRFATEVSGREALAATIGDAGGPGEEAPSMLHLLEPLLSAPNQYPEVVSNLLELVQAMGRLPHLCEALFHSGLLSATANIWVLPFDVGDEGQQPAIPSLAILRLAVDCTGQMLIKSKLALSTQSKEKPLAPPTAIMPLLKYAQGLLGPAQAPAASSSAGSPAVHELLASTLFMAEAAAASSSPLTSRLLTDLGATDTCFSLLGFEPSKEQEPTALVKTSPSLAATSGKVHIAAWSLLSRLALEIGGKEAIVGRYISAVAVTLHTADSVLLLRSLLQLLILLAEHPVAKEQLVACGLVEALETVGGKARDKFLKQAAEQAREQLLWEP